MIIINSKYANNILDLDQVKHPKATSGEHLVCYNFIELYVTINIYSTVNCEAINSQG